MGKQSPMNQRSPRKKESPRSPHPKKIALKKAAAAKYKYHAHSPVFPKIASPKSASSSSRSTRRKSGPTGAAPLPSQSCIPWVQVLKDKVKSFFFGSQSKSGHGEFTDGMMDTSPRRAQQPIPSNPMFARSHVFVSNAVPYEGSPSRV